MPNNFWDTVFLVLIPQNQLKRTKIEIVLQ